MNLDRFDTIKIKEKEDLDRLLKWRDNNKNLVRNFNPSLLEGIIQYSNYYKEYFKDYGLIVEFRVFVLNKIEVLHFTWNKLFKSVNVKMFKEDILNAPQHDSVQDALTVYASLMAYMEHYQDDEKRVKRKVKNINTSNSKKKKKSHNSNKKVIKIGKAKYNYSVVITKEQSEEKAKRKERKRPVGSWGVRGHWRKLKDGRRIWIKSYEKGEGRKKVKTYQV